ncbi:MAG: phosphate regulon sensor histidine kinase PhoR [Gammaproteobacteria bacterium]
MPGSWKKELWRVFVALLLATMVGALIGNVFVPLLIIALGYCSIHLYRLYQLDKAFHQGTLHKLEIPGGVWGEVYYHIHRLQKRNRQRKKWLTNTLSRFKESTSALPDGTVVLTDQWKIEWYNKAAKRLLGLKSKADIGLRIDNLLRDPRFSRYLSKNDFSEPLEIASPVNAQVQMLIRIIPYSRDQQLMVVRDITRLHRLEQMRRDFIANVSHELRTPLTVVKGYLETMGDDEAMGHWEQSIANMEQQVTRMDHIVADLLLLSRLDEEDQAQFVENIAITSILDNIKKDAIALAGEKQHDIKLDADNNLSIKGNAKELYSAFANLVFNAVRYTPAGGEIRLRWYRDDLGAHFEVKDNGPGIPPQHIPRLTERFYRVDPGRSRESGGTGLGLAIVKHVLIRHDGRLEINSTYGRGATFSCHFQPERIVSDNLPNE